MLTESFCFPPAMHVLFRDQARPGLKESDNTCNCPKTDSISGIRLKMKKRLPDVCEVAAVRRIKIYGERKS
jgi:hypothetical protein